MKKMFALMLVIFLFVACLVSCNHKHIKGEWEYDENGHWQPITCNLNSCNLEETPVYDHIDDDEDGYCDICNYPCGFFSEFVTSESVESIKLWYMVRVNAITIEDEEIIEDLIAFIADAKGEKGESSKGYYGGYYGLEIELIDGSTLDFYIWNKNQYTSSKYLDEEGYPFFFNADMSEMFEYLEEKYPESFWYSENEENTTTDDIDDNQAFENIGDIERCVSKRWPSIEDFQIIEITVGTVDSPEHEINLLSIEYSCTVDGSEETKFITYEFSYDEFLMLYDDNNDYLVYSLTDSIIDSIESDSLSVVWGAIEWYFEEN